MADENVSKDKGEMKGNNLEMLATFLKRHFPRCIPIPLLKEQKNPLYKHKDLFDEELWFKWDKEGQKHIANGHALGLTLREGIIVFDVDCMKWCDYLEAQFPILKSTVSCQTKKGKHYYFRRTSVCDDLCIFDGSRNLKTPRKEAIEGLDYDGSFKHAKEDDMLVLPIDTKSVCSTGTGGIIVIPPSPNKSWINPLDECDIPDVPQDFINYIQSFKEQRTTRTIYHASGDTTETSFTPTNNNDNKVDGETLKKIVMKLNDSRADTYHDWTKVCWAIFNIAHINDYKRKGNNLIHKFSKKSSKYNEASVETFINNTKFKSNGVGLGYLMECLKCDDKNAFKDIINKIPSSTVTAIKYEGYSLIDVLEDRLECMLFDIYDKGLTHEKAASLFCLLNNDFINVGDNVLYKKNEYGGLTMVNPSFQKELIEGLIKQTISPVVTQYVNTIKGMYNEQRGNGDINDETYNKKMNTLHKTTKDIISKIETVSFISGVYETIKQKILDTRAKELMDENHDIIMFKNGLLDLNTMELRKARGDEYVSLCMGGKLVKQPKDITPDDFKDADALINAWFEPDNSHYLKKFGGSMLRGKNRDELGHFFTGTGANGKSLAELCMELSFGPSTDGGYFGVIPSTTYTEPMKDADRAEPNKLKQRGIRVGWTNETSDKVEIISANYYRVCDNSGFDARTLHSKEIQKVKPQFKNIISTNYLARFTDDIVYATIRRIRVLPFIYTFASQEHYDPSNPKHKLVDTTLKDKVPALVEQFIMMFVYYYPIFKQEGLKPTQSMIEVTNEYIKSLDGVKIFFGENITRQENGKGWVDDLHARYISGLEDGEEKIDKRVFINKLKKSGYDVRRETSREENRKNQYYIHNFVLTDIELDEN